MGDYEVVAADEAFLIVKEGLNVAIELYGKNHDGEANEICDREPGELSGTDVLAKKFPHQSSTFSFHIHLSLLECVIT